MFKDSILNFPQQLDYTPEIINSKKLKKAKKFAVIGMGGSHLAADLIRIFKPSADLLVHTSYGLPELGDLKDRLIIFSSYSGNTEEVIDAFKVAQGKKLRMAVITLGGELLELAKVNKIPYIQLPGMNLQPRMALGLSLVALLRLIDEDQILKKLSSVSKRIMPKALETRAKDLAQKLNGSIPVIYSSHSNLAVAYNWKIQLNENSKTPAFYNVLPELNHNEMEGFEGKDSKSHFSKDFYIVILRDNADHPRILKRMEILEKLCRARGLKTETIQMDGNDVFQKVFNTLILGSLTAYHMALGYGVNPETVPMVEEFKKLMK